jgi:hypothetical protein
MKSAAALVTILALLSLPAAARAKPKPVTCRSGATLAAFPGLRIIAVFFRDHGGDRNFGYQEYACTSSRARPLHVGLSAGAGGAYEEDVERYDLVGGRYLAAGDHEEDEGGGRVTVTVWDLHTRRPIVADAPINGDEGGDPLIRLSAGGVAIDPGQGEITTVGPGHKPRLLTTGGAADVAVTGSTLYWTAADGVHSTTLPGPSGDAPDSFVDLGIGGLFPGRCRARIGNDVARDGWLRVAHGASGWFACRMLSRSAMTLPADLDPGSVRIAAQRWVYFAAGGAGHVVDVRRRTTVTTVAPGAQPLLLDDGRVAWLDPTGTVMAQRPGAAAASPLATGASALAAAGKVLYWTSGGIPQRG